MNASTPFMRESEVAEYLGIAPKTVSRWRFSRRGPAYHKFGGAVRYARKDVEAFASASAVVAAQSDAASAR